jgi:hypothetical protein
VSIRGGANGAIQSATTYAAVDEWYACDETISMRNGSDQLRLYIKNTVADSGTVYVKLQVKDESDVWCNVQGAPWYTESVSVGDCRTMRITGAGLCAGDEVKVFYKASLNAGTAELEIQALAHDSSEGSPRESFSPDFLMNVGMGNVPGYSFIEKFGENSDVDMRTATLTLLQALKTFGMVVYMPVPRNTRSVPRRTLTPYQAPTPPTRWTLPL